MPIENVFGWLQEWTQVIAGLGSVLLTGGLVYLYWQQQNLLKRELNRNVRHQHTETLRKRIRAWHGDIDELGVSDDAGFFSDETNLPKVRGASVEPADPLIEVVGRDTEFRVVPEAIEDDRYLRDLLENHASELQELKKDIEQLYRDFKSTKSDFRGEFADAPRIKTNKYFLNPTPHFDEWIFEKAVILNRGYLDIDKERLRAIAEDSLDEATAKPDPAIVSFTADARGNTRVYTYEAQLNSGNLDDLDEYRDEIEEEVLKIYYDAIDNLGSDGIYRHAVEAAQILDEIAEKIEELKSKLVEYEGHPLYMGDCPYLDEATL